MMEGVEKKRWIPVALAVAEEKKNDKVEKARKGRVRKLYCSLLAMEGYSLLLLVDGSTKKVIVK